MSMRYYGVNEYGLLMREEILTDELKDKIIDNGTYLPEFSGDIFRINDSGTTSWGDVGIEHDDYVYFLPLDRYPTLCRKVYNSVDEIVTELKKNYENLIPCGYDVRGNLVHIIGTIYG